MKFIVNFIDFIISTVTTVWDFFTSALENLMLMFRYIGIAIEICYAAIASLPAWLRAFASLTITISVLYMFLGRQTGGKKG